MKNQMREFVVSGYWDMALKPFLEEREALLIEQMISTDDVGVRERAAIKIQFLRELINIIENEGKKEEKNG